jgi:uncharacterized membrane protein (UPF0127 family)
LATAAGDAAREALPELSARNVTRGTVLAPDVEVAASLWGKFKGLMGRASLARGSGLWLPDSNGIHMMFMRFPIDAVFLGRATGGGATAGGGAAGGAGGGGAAAGGGAGGRPVVALYRGLRAWTGLVPLVRGAHGVLELPVGAIDQSKTQVGDLIEIR